MMQIHTFEVNEGVELCHMQRKRTIGLLTPFLGGNYLGDVITSIQLAASKNDAKLIAIRTAGKDFDCPIAMEHVDGWIVLNNAVADHYLKDLADRWKKPIVTIAKDISGLNMKGQMVACDNEGGIMEAVRHLHGHGHRAIGFIGQLNLDDMRERLSGYEKALEELELPFKPEFIIDPKDTSVLGGRAAAERIVELNFPFTAAVACTDMIAYGILERFQELGYHVPGDFALIGFDNTDTARTSKPSLASIEQHLDKTGEAAVELLLRQIGQRNESHASRHLVPCTLFARESCGCSGFSEAGPATEAMYKGIVEDYITNKNRITQFNVHYEFNKFILNYKFEMLSDLSWVLAPHFDWGMLGIWKGSDSEDGNMTISQYCHFQSNDQIVHPKDILIERFPPYELLKPDVYEKESDIIYMIPYRTEVLNWSVLSVGASWDKWLKHIRNHISIIHYLDLIASTLDRQALLEEVREQGRQYQQIAEHLEIVSRTSNDGIWDWDSQTGEILWNQRFYELLDTDRSHSFEELIHPDDLAGYKEVLSAHIEAGKPFMLDARLRKGDGSYIWGVLSGEALRDSQNAPIRMIGSVRDITERKAAEEKMRHMAYHDTLTGAMNRRGFIEKLLYTASIASAQFAVIMIDLDHFKKINDSYGHQLGDRLLHLVYIELKRLTKPEDAISRFGGDEFVIMYNYEHVGEVKALARAMGDSLSTLFIEDSVNFAVSMSAGISLFPRDGADPETLIKKADIAMYKVKQSGKNNYELFSPHMIEQTMWKINTENELKIAIEKKQFVLHYQPQFDLRTGRFFGVEALLRWNSPTQGLVSPMTFIELAEETGLIVPIGGWVLEEACRQCVEWVNRGYKPFKMSVNISGRQLKQAGFIDDVMAIIERTGMDPSFLCFEITESMIIDDLKSTIAMFRQLEQLGIQTAMDDFGTGYSSLSVLKKLPINLVKIDKSFIREITCEHQDISIVKAIISIAGSMGLEVIAEGVEQEEQYNLLIELGCHFMQGYYRSKPLPAPELERFLLV